MKLYIDASQDAVVLIYAEQNFLSGSDSEAFEIPGNEFFISLLPVCTGKEVFLPAAVLITNRKIIGENAFFRIIEWSESTIELTVNFPKQLRFPEKPMLLKSLVYKSSSGKKQKIELYRDNGLRLNVSSMNNERSYWLSKGTDGEMRLVDTGGEKLLLILSKEENSETLIAVNGDFEEIARIKADRCSFDDGYLSAITLFNTVLGHEKRERYEFLSGSFKKLPDEIGFFTQNPQMPSDADETALALVQAIKLKRENEIKMFLSDELYKNFSLEDLSGFLGDFEECRIAPWMIQKRKNNEKSESERQSEEVVIGLVKNGIAAKFIFTVANSTVTNITAE